MENILYQDNKRAMLLKPNRHKSAGKHSHHLNIQYFDIADKNAKGHIEIRYCPTDEMIRDYMTKLLEAPQVPFLMCTLEIPQKFAAQVLALNLLLFLLLSLFLKLSFSQLSSSQMSISLNYELFMYFCFCFFFHLYGSLNHTNSTSLSFSEFSGLFISTLLLSQLIESHFALSSARCHF